MTSNRVKVLREAQLMSKAELARKAGLSPLTVDRIEAGMTCRLDTKRKIILALGMTVQDRDQVFLPDANDESTGATPAPVTEITQGGSPAHASADAGKE